MKKVQKAFKKNKSNKFILLITLSIFVLFSLQFFKNFNFFNNTSEPLYEIFDKQCNSIGFYEINEYTEILETNKEYLGYCVLDAYAEAYATTTTINKNIALNLDSLFLNIPACKSNPNKTLDKNLKSEEELFIVGHAYGDTSSNSNFLPSYLTKYLKESKDANFSSIALTGDFVRSNDEASFRKVKNFIDANFKTYFLALGNHEVEKNGLENYFKIFKEDLFIQEYYDVLIIAANFSNPTWLPTSKQISAINTAIEETSATNILLLSHQIFWLRETKTEIEPNSFAFLTEDLPYNSVGWINDFNDKNLIIISGDYGVKGQQTFCLIKENKVFIANGIGNSEKNSILKLSIFKEFIYFEELYLNKNN